LPVIVGRSGHFFTIFELSLGGALSRRFLGLVAILLLAGGFIFADAFARLGDARLQLIRESALAGEQASRFRNNVALYSEDSMAPGVTMDETLVRAGATPPQAASIVDAAQGVYDLRHVRAGNRLEIGRSSAGNVVAIRYQIDADRVLSIHPAENAADGSGAQTSAYEAPAYQVPAYRAEVKAIPSHTDVTVVRGEVHDSLFNAVKDAGERSELAMSLAEIFGWDLDFYTDPRQGDTFRVVVEKKFYLDGQTAGYGRILAAEYINDGRSYQAVLFHDASGAPAYYGADGKSLQKAFLRSPLKFAAPITSHFSNSRFHPILKQYRPHLGVDFGAPAGTPVQAIGAGKVIFAASKGGDGNMVEIQHTNGFQTMYLHLSRILVRLGQRVEAGDSIGLVGMTGLATGPHLDFRILDHGIFRNFETLRLHLPPAEPVPNSNLAEFSSVRDRALAQMGSATLDPRSPSGQ
jgi:murein DD-endopeptidase MepM/ murein hydrolase activator NlpD